MSQAAIDSAELLARLDAIAPVIVAHRNEAEVTGDLSSAVVEALKRSELVNLFLPRSLGGVELDPVSSARIVQAVARLDSCAGWFLMVANAARLLLPRRGQRRWSRNYGRRSIRHSRRELQQTNEARRVEGGFHVEGQTSFASGCRFARWFLTPAICSSDGADEWIAVVVPIDQCEIVPNWSALGMRGTGSHDIRNVDLRADETHHRERRNGCTPQRVLQRRALSVFAPDRVCHLRSGGAGSCGTRAGALTDLAQNKTRRMPETPN
jgi:alkylation response protein AidB-like acyl-CoA dehydrogenase